MPYQLVQATPEHQSALQRFYKANQYKGRLKRNDTAWMLVENDPWTILASARISLQANVRILRGVWVAHSLRQQGLGRLLLMQMADQQQLANSYTFSYQHLRQFYCRMGYQYQTEVPAHLVTLYQRYNKPTSPVDLLYFPSPSDDEAAPDASNGVISIR